jgi:hypothetical protein
VTATSAGGAGIGGGYIIAGQSSIGDIKIFSSRVIGTARRLQQRIESSEIGRSGGASLSSRIGNFQIENSTVITVTSALVLGLVLVSS